MTVTKLLFVHLAIVVATACLAATAWPGPSGDDGQPSAVRARDFQASRASKTNAELARLLSPFGIGMAASPVRARS